MPTGERQVCFFAHSCAIVLRATRRFKSTLIPLPPEARRTFEGVVAAGGVWQKAWNEATNGSLSNVACAVAGPGEGRQPRMAGLKSYEGMRW